jgi:NAD+ synthase (glutamine-hydrolysing)
MKKIKIGGATLNQIPLDWANNTTNIKQAIQAARKEGVKILCLPELCLTGYGCEDLFLSHWVADKAWDQLQLIKEDCADMIVSIGLPVRVNGYTYNGACVVDNKKQYLAKDGVHYEPRWFEEWKPGEVTLIQLGSEQVQVGDVMYETEEIKFGFEICEDAWRKDKRPGYSLCKRGVDLIMNPSASHFAMGKSELREKEIVIDGSEKFKCAYLFVNHLGNEAGRMIYDGDIIIGQRGKLLAVNRRLSFKNFNLLACDVDFNDPQKSQEIKLTDSSGSIRLPEKK